MAHTVLRKKQMKKIEECWRALNMLKKREQQGASQPLVRELQGDGERFQQYFRLTRQQFAEVPLLADMDLVEHTVGATWIATWINSFVRTACCCERKNGLKEPQSCEYHIFDFLGCIPDAAYRLKGFPAYGAWIGEYPVSKLDAFYTVHWWRNDLSHIQWLLFRQTGDKL